MKKIEIGDVMLEQDIEKVLYSEEEIIAKTKELGAQLTKDYEGKNPLLIGVLKGSVPFMAELIKHIDTHVEIDFMVVSSYHGGVKSSGEVKILKDVVVRHFLSAKSLVNQSNSLILVKKSLISP